MTCHVVLRTRAEEYVYPFNVLTCFWVVYEWFDDRKKHLNVVVFDFRRQFRSFRSSIGGRSLVKSIHVSERKNILCSLQKSKSIHVSCGSLQNYIIMLSVKSKQCFSQLLSFSTERTGDDLAHSNHVFVNSRKWYLSFDSWISIKVSFTFQLHFSQTALV